MPPDIHEALSRLGLNPSRPAELYAFAEPPPDSPQLTPHRATFFVAGRILSGPAALTQGEHGTVRRYLPLSRSSDRCGLSIVDARQFTPAPSWQASVPAPVLAIDFRVSVPWHLSEPRPPVFGRHVRGGAA